jgi:hypothetical protein
MRKIVRLTESDLVKLIKRVLKEDDVIERDRHRHEIGTRQPGIEKFLSNPDDKVVADYLSGQLNDDPYTKNRMDISRRISIILNGMKMTPDQFINNIERDYSAGKCHQIKFYEYNNRILGKTQIKIDTTPGACKKDEVVTTTTPNTNPGTGNKSPNKTKKKKQCQLSISRPKGWVNGGTAEMAWQKRCIQRGMYKAKYTDGTIEDCGSNKVDGLWGCCSMYCYSNGRTV